MERNSPKQRDDDFQAPVAQRANDNPRVRKCLKCGEPFNSEWSGERVCKRCKSTGSWRSGRG